MRYVERYIGGMGASVADRQHAIEQINGLVRGPHESVVEIRTAVYSQNQWLRNHVFDPSPWNIPRFLTISGTVSESMDAVTRSLTLNVASEYWKNPFDAIKDLSPYRMMISVARGIEHPMYGTYWVPLGVYRVRDLNTRGSSEGSLEISINAYSMEADVRDDRFVKTPIAGTGTDHLGATKLQEIIEILISEGLVLDANNDFSTHGYDDSVIVDELDFSFSSGTVLTDERERMGWIHNMEKESGVWGRFDRGGVYTLSPMPTPRDAEIDFIVDAGPSGVLIAYDKGFSREGIYNGVMATGEFLQTDTDDPWEQSVFVKDTDSTSPTYWDGPFGRVPRFWSSQYMPADPATGQTLLQKTAQRLLDEALDEKAVINFEMSPNPLIEVGDVIKVRYAASEEHHVLDRGVSYQDDEIIREEMHMVKRLVIGLGADVSMTGETVANSTLLEEIAGM